MIASERVCCSQGEGDRVRMEVRRKRRRCIREVGVCKERRGGGVGSDAMHNFRIFYAAGTQIRGWLSKSESLSLLSSSIILERKTKSKKRFRSL